MILIFQIRYLRSENINNLVHKIAAMAFSKKLY